MSKKHNLGIKVIVYDSHANLTEVNYDTNGNTITREGLDVHTLEAALRGAEVVDAYLTEVANLPKEPTNAAKEDLNNE